MVISFLFAIFALLLFILSYFLLSGKATLLITNLHVEKKQQAYLFSLIFGVLFILLGSASTVLIFYHPLWLSFGILILVSLFTLMFIFGLNSLM